MSTKEEIQAEGDHIASLVQAAAAAGMTLLALVPEVATHCSVDDAKALHDFAGGPLRDVAFNLASQLEAIGQRYTAANGEVQELEQILAMPEAQPEPPRPGYL